MFPVSVNKHSAWCVVKQWNEVNELFWTRKNLRYWTIKILKLFRSLHIYICPHKAWERLQIISQDFIMKTYGFMRFMRYCNLQFLIFPNQPTNFELALHYNVNGFLLIVSPQTSLVQLNKYINKQIKMNLCI